MRKILNTLSNYKYFIKAVFCFRNSALIIDYLVDIQDIVMQLPQALIRHHRQYKQVTRLRCINISQVCSSCFVQKGNNMVQVHKGGLGVISSALQRCNGENKKGR